MKKIFIDYGENADSRNSGSALSWGSSLGEFRLCAELGQLAWGRGQPLAAIGFTTFPGPPPVIPLAVGGGRRRRQRRGQGLDLTRFLGQT